MNRIEIRLAWEFAIDDLHDQVRRLRAVRPSEEKLNLIDNAVDLLWKVLEEE